MAFLDDPRFQRAYAVGKATGSWGPHEIRWRVHVLCWVAEAALSLPGDFVECGVNRGGFARAIIEWLGGALGGKRFYLMDTFCGLVDGQAAPTEARLYAWYKTYYQESYAEVVETFRPFPFVELIRGPIPDTLSRCPAASVAFLHIDMNLAAPEIAAAEFFWPRLAPRAIVVLDDYGHSDHQHQKSRFDAWAAEKGVPIVTLPTGQGLYIKP